MRTMKVFVDEWFNLRGKHELSDSKIELLSKFFNSEKRIYFPIAFEIEDQKKCDCFLITIEKKLDWILEDTEILERNLYSVSERSGLIERAIRNLEKENLLNQMEIEDEEHQYLKSLNLSTLKPGVVIEKKPNMDEVDEYIRTAHESLGKIFFYTAGKSEIRVWQVDYGKPITSAAGQIHSDLERGFIRAEVYNMADFDKFSTLQEAKTKGILTMVDRTYITKSGDVIDVKFNV